MSSDAGSNNNNTTVNQIDDEIDDNDDDDADDDDDDDAGRHSLAKVHPPPPLSSFNEPIKLWLLDGFLFSSDLNASSTEGLDTANGWKLRRRHWSTRHDKAVSISRSDF